MLPSYFTWGQNMPEQRSNLESIFLLDRIVLLDASNLYARSVSLSHSTFSLLECLAQSAAYHARFRCSLTKHAFLAEYADISLPASPPTGSIDLRVTLTGSSGLASSYHGSALHNNVEICSGKVLIGLRDYDSTFRRDILQPHYERILQCLQNA